MNGVKNEVESIVIDWLTDHHECETCGTSYAEGAVATVHWKGGGQLIIDLKPVAHCTGGSSYDEREVYDAILSNLGYKVIHR